jgi:hypothetical protein
MQSNPWFSSADLIAILFTLPFNLASVAGVLNKLSSLQANKLAKSSARYVTRLVICISFFLIFVYGKTKLSD